MKELLWSLLNVSTIVFFLYLLIGYLMMGKRIFEGKLRMLSITFLVFGVVQILSAKDPVEKNNSIILSAKFDQVDYPQVVQSFKEDNMSLDFYFLITYAKIKGRLFPVKATGEMHGFVLGYDWELLSVRAEDKKPGEKADFEATGQLNWKLFGIKLYSQNRTFKAKI